MKHSQRALRAKAGAAAALVALAAVVLTILYVPSLLLFPYRAQLGDIAVYSEVPIEPSLSEQLRHADDLVAASDIADLPLGRSLYLTTGGWRWRLLALRSAGAFGFRRPFTSSIVLNNTHIDEGIVRNGREIGGVRSIAGVVAHETTHIMIARFVGEWRAMTLPKWIREGYADYVAQETSLDDSEAQVLRASDPENRALRYYDYQRRVASYLEEQTHSARDLFTSEGR